MDFLKEIEKALSVDELLNNLSLNDDKNYIPSDFALEFVAFIKLVNGADGEENKTPVMHYRMLDTVVSSKNNKIANLCFRGSAKALEINTPILTPNGYVPMKDLEVGDEVISRTGKNTLITHKSDTYTNTAYKITLQNGDSFIANEDHLHFLHRRTQDKNGKNQWVEEVMSTKEWLTHSTVYKRKVSERNPSGFECKWFIPLIENEVEFNSNKYPVDPYTVGLLIGDGNVIKKGNPTLTSSREDMEFYLSEIPYNTGKIYSIKSNNNVVSCRLLGLNNLCGTYIPAGRSWEKFIPSELLYGTIEDRLSVLQGLMDTDGTISDKGKCSFTSTSTSLAEGVKQIIQSLGGIARIYFHTNAYRGYYTVQFTLPKYNPFRLPRKASKWVPGQKYTIGNRVGVVNVEEIPTTIETQCISVACKTESYVIDGGYITHNTTLLGEYFFLYLATYGRIPKFGQVDLALYVSDSVDNGVKNMRKNLEHRWENSDFLKQYIPKIKFTDIRWEFVNADGKKFIVKGYGAKTGVRGTKEQGKRPQLAILDDLVSDEDARSPTVISAIEDTVHKAVTYALHPKKNMIIWSGTPFNQRDPLYKAVESGAWSVNVFPVCIEFPCDSKSFQGLWPDRFDYKYVKDNYTDALRQGKVDTFNQELMLRIMSDEDRSILDEDIQWYSLPTVLKNKGKFNFYITTDFATSPEESADYSVISVWAYNNNGDWYWVDGLVKRQDMAKNIDALFNFAQIYKPQSVGIEVTGQQGGFIPWLQNEMIRKNIFFTLASDNNKSRPGIRPTTNKLVRFNVVAPLFKAKKIYFPKEKRNSPELIEGINELTLISPGGFKSKHDDFIDTISMLPLMSPWKPSEEAEFEYNESDDMWVLQSDISEDTSYNSYVV